MEDVDQRIATALGGVPWPNALAARLRASSSRSVRPAPEVDVTGAPPFLPGDGTDPLTLEAPVDLRASRRRLVEVLVSRQSGGVATEDALDQPAFGAVLAATRAKMPVSLLPSPLLAPLICPVVFRVQGLPTAAYRYAPGEHALLPIRSVSRDAVRDECLLQREHGEGAALLFLVAPISSWLDRYGDRGYRGMLLQTGWLIDRLYLAAGTLGLTYTASGAFAPVLVDRLLGVDGYRYTTITAFVVGGYRRVAASQAGA